MASTIIIVLFGFVAVGVVCMVAVVAVGVRREERLFREYRQRVEDQGDWPGLQAPDQFLPAEAPDWASHAARVLTGLWIRRSRGAEPEAIPWYERRP